MLWIHKILCKAYPNKAITVTSKLWEFCPEGLKIGLLQKTFSFRDFPKMAVVKSIHGGNTAIRQENRADVGILRTCCLSTGSNLHSSPQFPTRQRTIRLHRFRPYEKHRTPAICLKVERSVSLSADEFEILPSVSHGAQRAEETSAQGAMDWAVESPLSW